MYVLAGPNGAGKSTLYETRLKRLHPDVEFVNADRLAHQALGRHATTLADAQLGQKLADDRRTALMAARADFITESTFSHESKLELVREAKAAGYRVQLYHVNVRSADISVGRVEGRVTSGGHDVPEQKIRERYERNQPLIRQAALESDRAYVFDNSRQDKPPRLVVGMEDGRVRMVGDNVPAWAARLYEQDLQRLPPGHQHPLAASFAVAQHKVTAELGDGATLHPARRDGSYQGKILAQTSLHTVQQVGRTAAVAHVTDRLAEQPKVGQQVEITYPGTRGADKSGKGAATVVEIDRTTDARAREQARVLREVPREQALKQEPSLKTAYGLMDAAMSAIPNANEASRKKVADAMRERLAQYIERGVKLPEAGRVQEAAPAKSRTAPEAGRAQAPERERER